MAVTKGKTNKAKPWTQAREVRHEKELADSKALIRKQLSAIGGNGLFATQAIKKGQLVCPLDGTRKTHAEVQAAPRDHWWHEYALGSSAEVTIAIVDRNGDILGLARTADAPVFGIDVAVQKARTAMFFSLPSAAAELSSAPHAQYLSPPEEAPIAVDSGPATVPSMPSGKVGRWMLPTARALHATLPVSAAGSPRNVRIAST